MGFLKLRISLSTNGVCYSRDKHMVSEHPISKEIRDRAFLMGSGNYSCPPQIMEPWNMLICCACVGRSLDLDASSAAELSGCRA